jgi:hypothetical protein
VQEFHAHFTVVPAVTVLVPGLNELLVTEIPSAGGGVFTPPVLGGGAVDEPPPPPQAHNEATAIATKTAFIGNRLLAKLVLRRRYRAVSCATTAMTAGDGE